MNITRTYFTNHHLSLSENKSKIMNHDASTGKTTFQGTNQFCSITLDQIITFKYLGIHLSSSPYCLFKNFNDQVKKKAKNYLCSVLSLVKSGPDRTELAYTLWTRVALPSILYGTEVIPITQCTINEVEHCQTQVGKFILQLPRSSSNVSASIDAGLKPVWSVVAEKVLLYAHSIMRKPTSYWPRIAMTENISYGPKNPYIKYLMKWKELAGSYGLHPKQIKASITQAAITSILDEQKTTIVSTFAMNCPGGASSVNQWFKPKSWVNDSLCTKIISEFRTCNIALGNRRPTKTGEFYKLCPLCVKKDLTTLNNEVNNTTHKYKTLVSNTH